MDLRANLAALAAGSQAARASGYAEKVPVSDLAEVLNMKPLPVEQWNTLNNFAYFTPCCCIVVLCGVYERLVLGPEELVMENGSCCGKIERKRE